MLCVQLIIFLLCQFATSVEAYHEKYDPNKPIQFYIVVPSYNNEQWVIKNLTSIATQRYPYWEGIFLNDASTDRTGILASEFIKNHNLKDRFTIVHNSKRVGSLANIYRGISQADPNSVVIVLDGDDWFASWDVFEILAAFYKQDPTLWLTYGSLIADPPRDTSHMCQELPPEVIRNRSYRSYKFVYHQLRTFYAGLFQQIKKKDLVGNDGKFLMSAGDLAFMLPMLEMASFGHFRYLPHVFYVYNMANPINDYRNLELQNRCADIARRKPSYQPLQRAPWRN